MTKALEYFTRVTAREICHANKCETCSKIYHHTSCPLHSISDGVAAKFIERIVEAIMLRENEETLDWEMTADELVAIIEDNAYDS